MNPTDQRPSTLRTSQRYSTSSVEYHDPEIYSNYRIEDIPCFHDSISRNTAEVLLLQNSEEGTFLIRRSETCEGDFSVSVRLTDSVKHFQIKNNEHFFTFGQAQFMTAMQIWVHLKHAPVLECDEGSIIARLLYPYINERRISVPLPLPNEYGVVTRQYETKPEELSPTRYLPSSLVNSKEGQLYKKKDGKNWKRRWFILNKNYLSYKKKKQETKPRKILDLRQAIRVEESYRGSKQNCFRIEFPKVAYMLSAESVQEKDKWITSIRWQIEAAEMCI